MSNAKGATNNPLSSTGWAALRADLRNFAVQHLPSATVPSRFMVLPELPKLANGKIDRGKLVAAPEDAGPERAYAPPETPEEIRVAGIWADLLSVRRVGLHDEFFELGGNSLSAVQMAARVREATGVAINLRHFFERPTVAGLVRLLDRRPHRSLPAGARAARSVTAEELTAEARLPDDVFPEPSAAPPAAPPYNAIFVTGGTGYTGAYLMRELLNRSSARLFVLVRARDVRHAQHRLRTNMQHYGVWRDGDEERISPVVGDLARPYFGLERAAYLRLAQQAEMIVHNGALSSYALSYRQLKPVNVLGTVEVLRLACRTRVKPVHYISSLAVYPGATGAPRWAEVEATDPEGVIGGYRQTKWVGDAMMHEAGRRGLPFAVYRPGLITGAQDTGACSTDTFINASIKGCIQLGATFPFDATLEATPVDFCAASTAHIALSGKGLGKVFNQPGGRSMAPPELFDRVAEFGYPMRKVSYADWYSELTTSLEHGEESELVRFLALFGDERPSDEMGYQGGYPVFETTNLRSALVGSGVVCEPPDQPLWDRYLRWFIATGYLPTPEQARASLEARTAARRGAEKRP